MITVKYFGQATPESGSPVTVYNFPDIPANDKMGKIDFATGHEIPSSLQPAQQRALMQQQAQQKGNVSITGMDTPAPLGSKLKTTGSIKKTNDQQFICLAGEEGLDSVMPVSFYSSKKDMSKGWQTLNALEDVNSQVPILLAESALPDTDDGWHGSSDEEMEDQFADGTGVLGKCVMIPSVTRIKIIPVGGEKDDKYELCAFVRFMKFSSLGRLINISGEKRIKICDVEEGKGDAI